MALIDLRQVNVYPYTKRITLGSTDVVQAITLPGDCTRFSLQFISHPGKYSHTGTDGAAIGTDYATIAKDSVKGYDRSRRAGEQTIYVAGSTGSVVCELELEARD